ncbi:hypothetical protein [Caproiciproducens sp. LBM24188]|nr:hypothetical protein [Oscillospiraceae bacterium]HHV31512.1 hypothetical protein [Clostridiales bacterium]
MTEPNLIKKRNARFQKYLHDAVEHFRRGEDDPGMKEFLSSMEELETLVMLDQNSEDPRIDFDQLLPMVRGLYFYMQNQDITGITDLLEYTLIPLSQEWFEGRED